MNSVENKDPEYIKKSIFGLNEYYQTKILAIPSSKPAATKKEPVSKKKDPVPVQKAPVVVKPQPAPIAMIIDPVVKKEEKPVKS